jgi:hypothetical protein
VSSPNLRQAEVGVSGLVFDRGNDLPLDPDGVTDAFRPEGGPCPAHSAERTCGTSSASLQLATGGSATVVSERLGHSSIAVTTDLYSHVAPGIQENASGRSASSKIDPDTAWGRGRP